MTIESLLNIIWNQCISDRNSLILSEERVHLSWLKEQEELSAGRARIVIQKLSVRMCVCGCVSTSAISLYVYPKHLKRKLYVCVFQKQLFALAFNAERLQLYLHHRWRKREGEEKRSLLCPSLSKCRAFWVMEVHGREYRFVTIQVWINDFSAALFLQQFKNMPTPLYILSALFPSLFFSLSPFVYEFFSLSRSFSSLESSREEATRSQSIPTSLLASFWPFHRSQTACV